MARPTPTSSTGHYDVLQIGRGAAPSVIRQAYRQRALATHPDKPGGQRVLFDRVVLAYESLSNADDRTKYDAQIALNMSRDGEHWSDTQPGTGVETFRSASGTELGESNDESGQSLRLVAVELWLKTFSDDISEQDLAGLSANQLTAVIKLMNQANQRSVLKLTQWETHRKYIRKHVQNKNASRTKFIEKTGGLYRVQVAFKRLWIRCSTDGCDLEQAIDYLGALTRMLALARHRGEASGTAVEPLNMKELADGFSQQFMPLTFSVRVNSDRYSPCTADLQLALSWWRDLKLAPGGRGWTAMQQRCSKQAQDSKWNQQQRAARLAELAIDRLQSRVSAQEKQQMMMAKQLEDVEKQQMMMAKQLEDVLIRCRHFEESAVMKRITDETSVSPAPCTPPELLMTENPAASKSELQDVHATTDRRKRGPNHAHASKTKRTKKSVGSLFPCSQLLVLRHRSPSALLQQLDRMDSTPEHSAGSRHAPISENSDGRNDNLDSDEEQLVARFTPEVDAGHCLARVWAEGYGGQCRRRKKDDSEFCFQHRTRWPYGRVDGTIPQSKLQEFLKVSGQRAMAAEFR